MRKTRVWNNFFIRYIQNQNILELNNLKVFVNNKMQMGTYWKENGEKGSDDTKVYISTILRLNYENVPTVLFFPLLFTWHNFV
jgi:hypothetical protein